MAQESWEGTAVTPVHRLPQHDSRHNLEGCILSNTFKCFTLGNNILKDFPKEMPFTHSSSQNVIGDKTGLITDCDLGCYPFGLGWPHFTDYG